MSHEDRLFQQFKANLEHYTPEVPVAAYSGMRRKLWMSQFMKFNRHSLNVWYIGATLLVGAGIWISANPSSAHAELGRVRQTHLFVNDAQLSSAQLSKFNEGCIVFTEIPEEKACCKGEKKCTQTAPIQTVEMEIKPEASIANEPAISPAVVEAPSTQEPAPLEMQATSTAAEALAKPTKPKKKYWIDTFQK